jgi:mannose-6-phosphate isomerase-like protein (cupin superfamily)
MYSARESESKLLDLPGRKVRVYIGTDRLYSDHMTMGMTEVPPQTAMTPHVHEDKEEVIFVIQGHGEVTIGDSVEKLEPNTAVVFPMGISHVVNNKSTKPMKFIFCFNPVNDFGKG